MSQCNFLARDLKHSTTKLQLAFPVLFLFFFPFPITGVGELGPWGQLHHLFTNIYWANTTQLQE